MRVVRWLALWAGTGLWVVVLAPALALVPAALLDRGSDGTVRLSLFPLALAMFDPFVWDCLWNSVVVALVVAFGSLVLGTGLARVGVRQRFWGRPVLTALTLAPLVVPPFFGAIGLRRLAGAWLVHQRPGAEVWPIAGWIGWVWVGLASGVPLVALATAHALARVEAVWEDAARLAGASRRQVWRHFVWPSVRPAATRAAATVFALTLIEPGAPLALGLRRSLSFQIVESVLSSDSAPRAAVLGLAAAAIALAARGLVRWWGGTSSAEPLFDAVPSTRAETASWGRATWFIAALGLGALLAWLPVLSLLAAATSLGRLVEPESGRLVLNALELGLAVVAIDLLLAWTLAAWAGRRHVWVLSLAHWPEQLPPLALGVAAAVLPGVLRMGADWSRADSAPGTLARSALALADLLDPYRTPGLLLALAVAAVRLPFLARSVEHSWSRSPSSLIDAARTLGATPWQSRRLAVSHPLGAPTAVLLLSVSLAATNLAPALVLAPTIESRPLAPGILILADEPGVALDSAATLATLAVTGNIAALALATKSRSVPLGDWLRGS